MNLLKILHRLYSKGKSLFVAPFVTDELIGTWDTNDSSGLFMFYGTSIRFEENGQDTMWYRNDGKEWEDKFTWKRTGQKAIEIWYDKPDAKPTFISYAITRVAGAYGTKDYKLVQTNGNQKGYSPDGEVFWCCGEPLLKRIK